VEAVAAKRRIIVVGAGFAGLCAAYELQGLGGYDVTLYEARDRVGGRVHSLPGLIGGKVLEGGGELIGSNHPLWLRYRHHFGLRFTPVKDYANSPVRFGKHTLSFEATRGLNHEMRLILRNLNRVAQQIRNPYEPWRTRKARSLDARSLASWLKRCKGSQLAKLAVAEQLAADNGVPAAAQSLLGVLAMIKGGGLQRYWDDTEVYRCAGGNAQLAECFRREFKRAGGRLFLRSPARHIEYLNGKVRVTVKQRGALRVREADDVILAVPPSVWHHISFSDPSLIARLSKPPQMGRNVKYLMTMRDRFWEEFASSPTLTEDGPVDITWETTEADATGAFGLVAFSGANDADTCSAWRARTRRTEYMDALKAPYPGIGRQVRRDRFMDWPTWTEASYHFPNTHEVTTWGPFFRSGYGGWLHFAGEHTCYAFVGYMGGALQSGHRLARRLAQRPGVVSPGGGTRSRSGRI
jgi:monoamine oxidase